MNLLTTRLIVFSALRVYALLDGKKLIAGLVLVLNFVPIGINIVGGAFPVTCCALSHAQTQYNGATSIVLQNNELCTILSPLSEGRALGCVGCSDSFMLHSL